MTGVNARYCVYVNDETLFCHDGNMKKIYSYNGHLLNKNHDGCGFVGGHDYFGDYARGRQYDICDCGLYFEKGELYAL